MRSPSFRALFALVALLALAGCQSSRAQRGDYPRNPDGSMASPLRTPAARTTSDMAGYCVYDNY